jgi:DNA-binding NarL/FixJ family response regulator
MTEMVRLERDGRNFCVTFTLTDRREAWRLAAILAEAVDSPVNTEREAHRWLRAACDLRQLIEVGRQVPQKYREKVKRPPNSESNEQDREWVVNGDPPYPVLTYADALRVLPKLRAKGLTTYLIARRLYVTEQTVYRMQRKLKKMGDRDG